MRELLLQNTSSSRRIGVLDHAKGGHSCEALTRLLREICDQTGETWDIDFHLMHPQDKSPTHASKSYSYQSSRFQVSVSYYPVTDLLVEDEDRLLGYGVQSTKAGSESFRLNSEGRILYCNDDEVRWTPKTGPRDKIENRVREGGGTSDVKYEEA